MKTNTLKNRIAAAALVVSMGFSTAATAELIAWQDFQLNTLVTSPIDGSGGSASDAAANASFGTTAPGTVFDSGQGLAWVASYADGNSGSGGPISGNDAGDLIGVVDENTFPGAQPSIPGLGNDLFDAGNRPATWFHSEDGDGLISLAFAAIDITGLTNLSMSFLWAANQAGSWESEDSIQVLVNDTVVFSRVGSELDLGLGFTDFQLEDIDLSAFEGESLEITVNFESNGGAEDLGFGDLQVFGTAIPSPGSMAIIGVGGLALVARQRLR